jgi:hypothetical protein
VSDGIEVATYTIIMRNVNTAAAVFPALLSVPEYRYVVVQSTINIQSRITRETAARANISLVPGQYNKETHQQVSSFQHNHRAFRRKNYQCR